MTTPFDPAAPLADIDAATNRLLETARRLTDADVKAPSLLPDWSRGHVLAHIARNADGLRNLLVWAATGVETPQYVDRATRDADIDAGAPRPIGEQLRDLEASAAAFASAAKDVPADRWTAMVRWLAGDERPAKAILSARLREVEIHHVDLAAGYTPSSWPAPFAAHLLDAVLPALTSRGLAPVTLTSTDPPRTWEVGSGGPAVTGSTADLLAWLIGRSDGTDLAVSGAQPLPTPPPWA